MSLPVRLRVGAPIAAAMFVAAAVQVAPAHAAPANIAGMIVFLDPGHQAAMADMGRQVPTGRGGTKDCQASGTSTDDGYPEHTFTWDTTLKIRQLLAQYGVRTAMSRGDDAGPGPCVDARAQMANALQPNAIVSIHGDGGPATGRGFHVLYSSPPLNQVQAGPAVVLAKTVRGLRDGDSESGLKEVPQAEMGDVDKAIPLVDRAEKSANTVMSQQKILTQVGTALRTINRQSSDLLEIAETISSLKLQQNAAAAEISASGQLVMLTQRIGKSANEFLTMEGVSPEAVFLLGKDLNSFKEIGQGLLDGSPELRLAGSKDPQTRERLEALLKLYEDTRGQAGAILGNLQGLVSAREAQASIVADSEPLRRVLEDLQAKLSARTGLGAGALAILLLSALLALLFAGGLAYVQLQDSRQRQRVAESQRLDAERQEQEAKRVNDANQAAATSYYTYTGNVPPTYGPTSNAIKWGDTTPGTGGGIVKYWFDAAANWNSTEKTIWEGAFAQWSGIANISFALADDATAANVTIQRLANKQAYANFNTDANVPVGSNTIVKAPATGAPAGTTKVGAPASTKKDDIGF